MRAVEGAMFGDIGNKLQLVLLDGDDIVDQVQHPRKDKRICRIDSSWRGGHGTPINLNIRLR